MVESHVVVYFCTAVEITTVVVKCLCAITKRSQCTCRTLKRCRLHISLVRILSRSKETHIHSGKYLELCIRCTCSYRWNFKISARIVSIKLSEIWDRILGKSQPFYLCRIKIRFQLDKHDIRQLLFRTTCLTHVKASILVDLCHRLFAVTGRLIDSCIK